MLASKHKLETIYLHVTNACNLRCVYCYLEAGDSPSCEISINDIYKLHGDIAVLCPKKIVITGGEPLLHPDFLQLLESFHKIRENSVIVCVNSNGSFIDRDMARHMAELSDQVRISIDGMKKINDSLRDDGAFSGAINAIHNLRMAGIEPEINITVTRKNIDGLKFFLEFILNKENIANIHLNLFKPIGRGKNRDDLLCSIENIRQVISDFWQDYFGGAYDENKTSNIIPDRKPQASDCGIGRYINILPDGSVYPCHVLSHPDYCLGNIRSSSLASIYNGSNLLSSLIDLSRVRLSRICGCSGEFAKK